MVQALWLDSFGHVYPGLLQSETRIQIGHRVYAVDVINVMVGRVEVVGDGFELVI